MFNCEKCKKVSSGRMNKVVVEKRNQTYSYAMFRKDRNKDKIILAGSQITPEKIKELEEMRYKEVKRWQTSGWEIAKEITVCTKCLGEKK